MNEATGTQERERGANVRIPPPIIPVIGLVVGLALDAIVRDVQPALQQRAKSGINGKLLSKCRYLL